MKYHDLYQDPWWKPHEKEYKESIVSLLCDHFCHEDIHIVLAGFTIKELPVKGQNVIVFFCGNEASAVPSYINDVGLIYTDNWLPTMPSKMKGIPVGFNEDLETRFIQTNKLKPISQRSYDISFIGSYYNGNRDMLLSALKELQTYLNIKLVIHDTYFYLNNFNNTTIQEKKKIYLETLADTKIIACPFGAIGNNNNSANLSPGWETFRFCESLIAGNIILTTHFWSEWHKGPNIISLKNWKELTSPYVKSLLDQDLDTLQKEGIKHFRKKLSRVNILNSIIQDIEQLLITI